MMFFIRTQLYGIGKSKRLLGTLLFAPALLLFCSFHAESSWMPARLVLAMFASLTAMLSSEILHWLMIDEIKDGLFDIILISPVSRFRILMGKLTVQVAGGILFAVSALLINNCMAMYGHFTVWTFSISSCSFLAFAAIFSALLEFISLLVARKNNTNVHFLLLGGSIFLLLWVYCLIEISLVLFYAVTVLLLFISVISSLHLLKMRYQVTAGGSGYCFTYLFGNRKIGLFGAFFRKNISTIRYGKYTWLQFLIALLPPILLIAAGNIQSKIPINQVLLLMFSPISTVTNIYFVFYSALYENRNQVSEILQIRGISNIERVMEKAVSAGIISSVLCTVSFLAACVFAPCDFILLPVTMIHAFLSAILSSVYSSKIHSFKGENIHKVVISLLTIAVHCMALLLVCI